MKVNIGERVIYQFDEEMAQRVNNEIASRDSLFHGRLFNTGGSGGNKVMCGQFCAAIVTRVHGSGVDDVNLKLILDAPFDLWLEGVKRWNGSAEQSCNKWRLAA